jgi:hypothetical protein
MQTKNKIVGGIRRTPALDGISLKGNSSVNRNVPLLFNLLHTALPPRRSAGIKGDEF